MGGSFWGAKGKELVDGKEVGKMSERQKAVARASNKSAELSEAKKGGINNIASSLNLNKKTQTDLTTSTGTTSITDLALRTGVTPESTPLPVSGIFGDDNLSRLPPNIPPFVLLNPTLQFQSQLNLDVKLYGSSLQPNIDLIKQGGFRDCYFLASLGAVLNSSDGQTTVKNMIHANDNGSYDVTFKIPSANSNGRVKINSHYDIPAQLLGTQNEITQLFINSQYFVKSATIFEFEKNNLRIEVAIINARRSYGEKYGKSVLDLTSSEKRSIDEISNMDQKSLTEELSYNIELRIGQTFQERDRLIDLRNKSNN